MPRTRGSLECGKWDVNWRKGTSDSSSVRGSIALIVFRYVRCVEVTELAAQSEFRRFVSVAPSIIELASSIVYRRLWISILYSSNISIRTCSKKRLRFHMYICPTNHNLFF